MQRAQVTGGELVANLVRFARTLRCAGLAVDGARVVLAIQSLLLVGVERRADMAAALEAVLVCNERDRTIFRTLFDLCFHPPAAIDECLADDAAPLGEIDAPAGVAARWRDALNTQAQRKQLAQPAPSPQAVAHTVGMAASDMARLRHADFNTLTGADFDQVQQLARDVRLPMPDFLARRVRAASHGSRLYWPGVLHEAVRHGGEVLRLPRMRRCRQPLPLLVLLDVSGSMERYVRPLLAFVHAATSGLRQREVFAFGTQLTNLGPAMRSTDTDAMLAASAQEISDYGGGTRLGASLSMLRQQHARSLVGRRTVVLLVSDGLETGDSTLLAHELDWLRRHSRRLLWLNPLLRFAGYVPSARSANVLRAHANGMLAVHNIDKLEQLASNLATLLRR